MEILNTVEMIYEYRFGMTITLFALVLFFVVAFVVAMVGISDGTALSAPSIVILLVLLVMFSLSYHANKIAKEQGVQVYYEAIVTDFNEVYKQGYEITDKRGEIYILEKKQ